VIVNGDAQVETGYTDFRISYFALTGSSSFYTCTQASTRAHVLEHWLHYTSSSLYRRNSHSGTTDVTRINYLAAFSCTDLQFLAVIDLHHLVGIYGTRCLNIQPSVPIIISSGGSDQLICRTTSWAKLFGSMPLPLPVLTMMSVAASE
jgi:hypothetical protein